MKRMASVLILAVLVAGAVPGQEKKTGGESWKMNGYVVDQMCAKGMAKKAHPMEKAAGHTKECALEEACAASGYGIFSNGKWMKFDAAGDKLAKQAIEKSKREKGLMFEVTGTIDGEVLAVTGLKETSPDQKPDMK